MLFVKIIVKRNFQNIMILENNTIKLSSLLKDLQEYMINVFHDRLNRIYVFGSYARGDNDNESDVDFLVIIDDDINKYDDIILDIIVEISLKHDKVVPIFLENHDAFNKYSNIKPLYKIIKQEGIEIYAA